MKFRTFVFLVLLAGLSPARGELIQQFAPWSVPNQAVGQDLFAFQPFDTSLGILDQVTFSMVGNVMMNSLSTPNLLPAPSTGIPTPTPFGYQVRMDMDLFSLAGFDVEFNGNAQFLFGGTASGVGEPLVQSRDFSLTARFDPSSDIVGFDLPSTGNVSVPPLSVSGTRGEFEENPLTAVVGLQFQMLNIWTVVFEDGAAAQILPMGSTSGLITLDYRYTPFEEPPLPQVPVPGALWLMATALAGLLGICGKRGQS